MRMAKHKNVVFCRFLSFATSLYLATLLSISSTGDSAFTVIIIIAITIIIVIIIAIVSVCIIVSVFQEPGQLLWHPQHVQVSQLISGCQVDMKGRRGRGRVGLY